MHCPCVGLFLFFNFQMHNWAQHSIRFLLYYSHVVQSTLPYQLILNETKRFTVETQNSRVNFTKFLFVVFKNKNVCWKSFTDFSLVLHNVYARLCDENFACDVNAKKENLIFHWPPKNSMFSKPTFESYMKLYYKFIYMKIAYIHWSTYKNVIEKYPVAGNGCSRRTEWIHWNERNGKKLSFSLRNLKLFSWK